MCVIFTGMGYGSDELKRERKCQNEPSLQPDSTNGYSTGDRVVHNDRTWESLADNNVWEPGAAGAENLWQEVK